MKVIKKLYGMASVIGCKNFRVFVEYIITYEVDSLGYMDHNTINFIGRDFITGTILLRADYYYFENLVEILKNEGLPLNTFYVSNVFNMSKQEFFDRVKEMSPEAIEFYVKAEKDIKILYKSLYKKVMRDKIKQFLGSKIRKEKTRVRKIVKGIKKGEKSRNNSKKK